MTPARTQLQRRPDTTTSGGPRPAGPLTRRQRAAVGLLAVVLIVAGSFLPLWQATLDAPQYPGGLHMVAYGSGVAGDVAEIDSLNHYIGMRAFRPEDVPELRLWPLAVASAATLALVAAFARRRTLRRLAVAYVWLVPVGVLADIQFRLYQFGHDLDPMAALRIPEFTPLVVGPTKVWNFTTWALPGTGLFLMAGAALVLTVGPRVMGRVTVSHANTPAAAVLTLVLVTALPGTALAGDGHEHDHGGHGAAGSDRTAVPDVEVPAGAPTPTLDASDADEAGAWLARRLTEADAGETIVLEPRSYRGNFVVEVPIVLDGDGVAMLATPGTGSTLTIRAPGTTVRGLHVHGSGPGPTNTPSGIWVTADDVTIASNVIHDAYIGIGVRSAKRARLTGNRITGRETGRIGGEGHALEEDAADHSHHTGSAAGSQRGDAISLWDAEGVLIRGNLIEAARDGVLLSFGSDALIDGNVVRHGRYAIHSMYATDLTIVENRIEDNLSGLVLMYGGPALVLGNQITDNLSVSTGFGLLLKDVADAEVTGNTLAGNSIGIHVDGPTGTTGPSSQFDANTVSFNQVGVALYPSARSVFRANNFVGNLVQVLAKGRGVADHNVWSDRGLGNYWSTYQGYGAAGSGIGAVPHLEGHGTDRLLEAAPVLTALATSPALKLLRAVEERWTRATPVVVDELPLTRPIAQARPFDIGPADDTPVATMGLLILLAGLASLLLSRRSRRRTPTTGGPTHATT